MFKKYSLIFLMFGLFVSFGFGYQELLIENRDNKPIRVIKVVLDGEHFVVSSVAGDGGATLPDLAKKVGGTTAVNGTFFCPDDYTSCEKVTHTTSERVFLGEGESWSRYWPDTSIRMVFGFDKMGEPLFVQNNLGQMYDLGLWLALDKEKFDSLYFGIGGFPAFLYDGDDVMDGYTNYIDTKMKTAGNKTFICSTKDNTTIYMGVIGGINLPQMPEYLKKNFECWNALNLDAGESIGMMYSGLVLDQGRRTRIMDAFVVLTRDEYIKLTGITPKVKTPFKPENDYRLTSKDRQKIEKIYSALKPFVQKNGSKQKRSFISLLRSAVTSPKIVSDPQKLAIIKELLILFFVGDKA